MARTGSYLGGLVMGRESADQLSGPIRIAEVSGEMAKIVLAIFFAAFSTVVSSSITHGTRIQEEAVLQTEVRAAGDSMGWFGAVGGVYVDAEGMTPIFAAP